MMKEFTIKDMSALLYEKLSKLKDFEDKQTETTLDTSQEKITTFPCRLINPPLEFIEKTQNAIPIRKKFQTKVEHIAISQADVIEMANNTDLELRKIHFVKTLSESIMYDEKLQKYKQSNTYEVRYNMIFNTFEFIK